MADLDAANLARADLRGADLSGTALFAADLRWADLSGAALFMADLRWAYLREADLSRARFGSTVLGDNDLSQTKGLDTAVHVGPSTIGIDTIQRSGGKIPKVFLRGAGVPDNWIEYIGSLVGQPIQFYSCYIAYSTEDQEFADRLYADLEVKG
ncbi:MAG: pentapeptide repeat-containing protein, partial [Acidobacteria bacterium]|nr:pentapeptide repeat-containing protein [Acidobacteriota bacterium]